MESNGQTFVYNVKKAKSCIILWYPLILIVCKIVLVRNTDPEIGYFQKNKTWSYLKRTPPIYMGLQFLQFIPSEIKNNEGNDT